MASPASRNIFLGTGGDGVNKSILALIQKNRTPHRVMSECVVWWRGEYA